MSGAATAGDEPIVAGELEIDFERRRSSASAANSRS